MTWRRAFLAAVLTVVVSGVLIGATPSSSAPVRSATLSSVVLKAAQVGPGYVLQMRADSHCVQRCVTLDMCGFHFKSEAERIARLQVNYVKKGAALKLSNEVVRYQTGGTALAVREINRAVKTCPSGPVKSSLGGLVTYRIHRFTAAGLLPEAIDLRIHESGTYNGHAFSGTFVAIYQVRGRLLSGVYAEVPAGSTVAATRTFAVHAARASAKNLEQSRSD